MAKPQKKRASARKAPGRPNGTGKDVIFRPWITTKDGRRIYARQFGIRAFPIPVE